MSFVTPRNNPANAVVRYGESSQADALQAEREAALARIIAMPVILAGGLVLQIVKLGVIIGVGYMGLNMLKSGIK